MNVSCRIVFPTLIFILLTATCGSASRTMEAISEKGPRTEDIIIRFYEDLEAAYAALKAGEVDLVGDKIMSDLYADAIADSNIVLGGVGDRGMYQIDINNNCTIPSYRGIQSPTYGVQGAQFRKALTLLIDKNKVVSEFCGGFADRIDQPIAYVQRGWRNSSCWYEDGTGPEFNPAQAASILDTDGWIQGTTPNPHYEPSFPGSAQYIRTYPSDHPQKPGQNLDPLEYCIRTDDARRLCAGRHHCDNLRKHGIPVNQFEADSSVLYPKVMDNLDYHLYTGGFSHGRFPSLTLYYLYRTPYEPWISSNYVTGFRCDGGPNYPILDQLLFKARYPASYDEFRENTKKLLGYGWCEMYITIPLFSPKGFYAWSSDLLGVVNAEEIGPINRYMLMNAYKVLGDPIRCGLAHAPDAMNKIYSGWHYDYQCLDRMELYSEMDVPPYDQSLDQPGYILNWTVDTWTDPDDASIKSNVTQTYRDDAWFVEPVTGNQLEHVNITHRYASIWYDYQLSNAWNNDGVIDIKTLRITGSHTIEIYWTWSNFWFTYLGGTSLKSFNWWSKGNLSQTVTETLTSDGSGWLSCTEPVFYVLNADSGGTPLVLGTDYDIYRDPDGPHNADVRVINPAYLGAPVNITYLATNDAFGYTPGNLPWQDAFEGAGMYYAVDFVPGTEGYLSLKRNPFYPMETPPLGEIDFIKKPNGCYKIDIFDIVRAVSAYGSQGISVPDSNWFPGADLAYPGGRIDIFDIVTIAGKYGREWDCYP